MDQDVNGSADAIGRVAIEDALEMVECSSLESLKGVDDELHQSQGLAPRFEHPTTIFTQKSSLLVSTPIAALSDQVCARHFADLAEVTTAIASSIAEYV